MACIIRYSMGTGVWLYYPNCYILSTMGDVVSCKRLNGSFANGGKIDWNPPLPQFTLRVGQTETQLLYGVNGENWELGARIVLSELLSPRCVVVFTSFCLLVLHCPLSTFAFKKKNREITCFVQRRLSCATW